MKSFDCVVCGSCVIDVLCRAVPLAAPVGRGALLDIEPPSFVPGGITVNAGVGLARLGLSVAVLSVVGRDASGTLVRDRLRAERVDDTYLLSHPDAATRVTVVLIDEQGHRSLLCGGGASQLLEKRVILEHLELFAHTRLCLFGYFGHMPALDRDLPEVMRRIKETGCRTALDAAPGATSVQLLERLLPYVDVYVPSYDEARAQTGVDDPRDIVGAFRRLGAAGLVGVKLGAGGVVLSEAPGNLLALPALPPPGPVIDTTGAGDAFYAGLIAGLLGGLTTHDAGRLGVAAGARAVTVRGGAAAVRDLESLRALAGVAR